MALTPLCLDLALRNWQNRLLRPHFTQEAIKWLSEVIEWLCTIIVTDTVLTLCGLYYIVGVRLEERQAFFFKLCD